MRIIIEMEGCSIPDDLNMKIPCHDCEDRRSCKVILVASMIREIRDILDMPPEQLERLSREAAFKVITQKGGEIDEG